MKGRAQLGGALIEFAIALPLLLIILFGIVEFGLILYNKAVLTNGSREGARYGIVASNPGSDIEQVVKDYCEPRLKTFGTVSTVSASTKSYWDPVTPSNRNLEVHATWTYNFLVFPKLPQVGLNDTIDLSATTVMKYE